MHAPCRAKNSPRADKKSRTRPVQSQLRPVQNSLSTVRVEPEHAPCAEERIRMPHGHAPCNAKTTDTVHAKTRATPLPLLHGPCSCPVCGRSNAHASLARSVLMTRAAPFLLLLGALHTHGLCSQPELNFCFFRYSITATNTLNLPLILLRDSPKPCLKLNQPVLHSQLDPVLNFLELRSPISNLYRQ